MNFDLGDTLTCAGKISWRHKSIWGLLMLPMLVAFVPFALFVVLFFSVIWVAEADLPGIAYAVLGIVFLLLFVLTTAVNYMVSSLCSSAATLGIIRAERGEGSTKLMDLLRDGRPYFWRILGVTLAVNLTLLLAYGIFTLLGLVLILVTFGMASICMQPIMLLLTPLMFLVIGITEAAEVAVITRDMSVMDAIKYACQVVRAHVWKYIGITLIVYFGTSILSSIVVVPLMMPAFALPLLLELGGEVSLLGMALISALFFCVFIPVMILVSSVMGVFMKTALDLTSLRLTQNAENQV
ncbi:hypothetical protein ANAEL_00137 [Anaerolineales bacterium]|nr:hypothetical protein ANAEL_00137 [Anaerolineales bacterium]